MSEGAQSVGTSSLADEFLGVGTSNKKSSHYG